jgi:hypothetical protein
MCMRACVCVCVCVCVCAYPAGIIPESYLIYIIEQDLELGMKRNWLGFMFVCEYVYVFKKCYRKIKIYNEDGNLSKWILWIIKHYENIRIYSGIILIRIMHLNRTNLSTIF